MGQIEMIAPAAQSSKVQVQRGRNVRIQTRDVDRTPADPPRFHTAVPTWNPATRSRWTSMALLVIEIGPASDPDERSLLVVVNSPEPTDY